MEKGAVLMIYEDPLTQKRAEGKARLLTKLDEDPFFEYWRVRFEGDYHTVTRKIKKN